MFLAFSKVTFGLWLYCFYLAIMLARSQLIALAKIANKLFVIKNGAYDVLFIIINDNWILLYLFNEYIPVNQKYVE